MSKLMLVYYQGNLNFGIIGTETRFSVNGVRIKLGDTITYKTYDGFDYGIVVLIGDKVCVLDKFFSRLDNLDMVEIKRSGIDLRENDTLNSLRIKVREVKDLK